MGTSRNALDAATIVIAFYFGATVLAVFGMDIFLKTIFTPVGAVVSWLLAFMETSYNRF